MASPTTIKCVVVGDGSVGKTCLLYSYCKREFLTKYIPTIFENYVVSLTAGEKNVELSLYDTAGQEEYDRIRPLSYFGAHIIIVCFSVMSSISFENVSTRWFPELNHFSPETPILLVGTKKDMKDDPQELLKLQQTGQSPISLQKGSQLASKIGAVKYLECSAKTREGVKEIFDEAVISVLTKTKKKKRKLV